MSKKFSKYAQKFSRRVSDGKISYEMTVNRDGQPTLSERDFRMPYECKKSLRSFSRVRRFDEIVPR